MKLAISNIKISGKFPNIWQLTHFSFASMGLKEAMDVGLFVENWAENGAWHTEGTHCMLLSG